jgi:acetyltransferase-like isoleucine patch superfamily enzyme
VERDGYMRLDAIHIGSRAVINTYTQIAPGAVIPPKAVYGPHASSHERPVASSHASINRTIQRKPHFLLQLLFAWPIILAVKVASYVPWFVILWLMITHTSIQSQNLNAMESIIEWFAAAPRIKWHISARVVRVICQPLIQLILGIIIKRVMGLNHERSMAESSQWILLRRYINSVLLSQHALRNAFDILGTHYEMTSIVFRAMGARIGKRVYWPGSGIYCQDPELLTIGDDVVFGSRSELFTTDALGTGRITIGSGAMIADRVVLRPCTTVGRKTVMGSGALGRRGGIYPDGSTWMGSENGEAVCFSPGKGVDLDADTITPFGRAFYKREASFFVIPYPILVFINMFVAGLSAGFWSLSAIAAAQLLRQLRIHLPQLRLFYPYWFRTGVLFGFIATSFVIVLNIQALIAILWTIGAKWLVIGRREAGPCEWDKSSYCQRWQLHLTLSRPLHRGYGNGGVLAPLGGSAYIVWYYRALGAKIGKDCAIWAGGKAGLMTEPDLVELGDRVALDDCSVVAHINSRGKFALNKLSIGEG